MCSFLSPSWLMTLYVHAVPDATVLRIWDAMFFEGSVALFRAALAIISIFAPMIQDQEPQERLLTLRSEAMTLDADLLMHTAYSAAQAVPSGIELRKIRERHRKVRVAVAVCGVGCLFWLTYLWCDHRYCTCNSSRAQHLSRRCKPVNSACGIFNSSNGNTTPSPSGTMRLRCEDRCRCGRGAAHAHTGCGDATGRSNAEAVQGGGRGARCCRSHVQGGATRHWRERTSPHTPHVPRHTTRH